MRHRQLWLPIIPIIVCSALVAMTQQRSQLSSVHFPISCRAESQAAFNRAMALLHGAWVEEANHEFATLTKADPDCAMAYWGVAVSQLTNPLRLPVSAGAVRQGWAAVAQAKRLGGQTVREQEYIDAVESFFRDPDGPEPSGREQAYEQAMAQLSRHHPEDREAAVFYALALLMGVAPTDTTDASRLKAAAILEQVLIEQPDHPGVRFHLLQAYDAPALAQRGLLLARRSAKLTGVGPCALHLPAPIFTRLGLWEEAVRANVAAIAAATLHHALVTTRQEEWAAQVEIQQRVAEAWIARAERRHEDALRLMQTAASLEASHNRPAVMPGPLAPTRELLAELLLEGGHLQQAQQAFETLLHREPRRLNALYGAAHTAELAGNLAKASSLYDDLLALSSEAASSHVYVSQARAFLDNIDFER
jgi:hypothetical protein